MGSQKSTLYVPPIEMDSSINIIKITMSWYSKIVKEQSSEVHTEVDMSARIKL